MTLTIIVGITFRQLATPDELRSSVNVIGRMVAWGGQPFGAAMGALIVTSNTIATAYGLAAAVMLIAACGAAIALHRTTPVPSP